MVRPNLAELDGDESMDEMDSSFELTLIEPPVITQTGCRANQILNRLGWKDNRSPLVVRNRMFKGEK